jgi:hypothetical protein
VNQPKRKRRAHNAHEQAKPARQDGIEESSEIEFLHQWPEADRQNARQYCRKRSLQELFHRDVFWQIKKTLEILQRDQHHPDWNQSQPISPRPIPSDCLPK